MALGFTLVVTLVTGLAIGLLPALQASRVNVQETLKDASRGSTGAGQRLRAGLLVAEVSLSLVLLIAAGLLLTSFARLQRVEPGFQPDGVFTAQLVAAAAALRRRRSSSRSTSSSIERLSTLPGGTSAALTDRVPLTGGHDAGAGGRHGPSAAADERAAARPIATWCRRRYFETLGIPIRAGRDFDERDSARVPHVVIINETFARRHFPGEDPLGRTLITGMGQLPSQIVGVVADVRSTEPQHAAGTPTTSCRRCSGPRRSPTSWCAPPVAPAAMAPLVREALRAVDPDLPLLQPQTLTDAHRADRRRPEAGAGAARRASPALALVLASLGVYSVMAHLVAFRTSEIGIRMALGATPGAVMRMVLGHGRSSRCSASPLASPADWPCRG